MTDTAFLSQHIPIIIENLKVAPRSCRCLSLDQVNSLKKQTGSNDTYGVGCAAHNTSSCLNSCADKKESCAYCDRQWCYVASSACDLAFTSTNYSELGESFPACGYDPIPSFTVLDPIERSLRVAYLHNSGGYTGSFNEENISLLEAGVYYGPLVRFVQRAAKEGSFKIIQTAVPGYIDPNGRSAFSRCLSAIQIGVVDVCVGNYVQTSMRVLSSEFYETHTSPVVLVMNSNEVGENYVLKSFEAFLRPFTKDSWIAIFTLLAILGLLMLFHEYDVVGSTFPKNQKIIVTSKSSTKNSIEYKQSSMAKYLLVAPYMAIVGWVMNGAYSLSVVSWGAKVNLLALSFFLLTIWSAYNANLYSFVSQDVSKSQINSLADILAQPHLKVCLTRQMAVGISTLFPQLSNQMVLDEDKLPGFTGAQIRTRVLTSIVPTTQTNLKKYECQAALTAQEDYWKFLEDDKNCNLKFVATDIPDVLFGMPISKKVHKDFVRRLNKLKFANWFDFQKESAKPQYKCSSSPKPEVRKGMSIRSLSFVFIISFAFVGMSFIITLFRRLFHEKRDENTKPLRSKRYAPVHLHNQWNEDVVNTDIVDEEDVDDVVNESGQISLVASDSWEKNQDDFFVSDPNVLPKE